MAGSPQVVVTADLCGFSGSMTERLVAWAAATHSLERSQLILNCSHNHSGPVFDDVLPLYYDLTEQQLEVTGRYTVFLEAQVQAAITAALAALAPASVTWGQGLCGFAVNRRRSRSDSPRSGAAEVVKSCPFAALRCPWGRLGSVLDVRKRRRRVRGRFHRLIQISTGPQQCADNYHDPPKFSSVTRTGMLGLPVVVSLFSPDQCPTGRR